MKRALRQRLCLLVFFATLLSLCGTKAFGSFGDMYDIDLTGTVLPSDDKGGPKIFEFWVPEKTWMFRLTNVRFLSPGVANDWMLMNRISPRRIKLVGKKETLQPLNQSNITGKSFRLRGRLFFRTKTLNLSLVEEVIPETPTSESK